MRVGRLTKKEENMPKILRYFLQSLSAQEAVRVWDWLDSNPNALDELIQEVSYNPELLKYEQQAGGPAGKGA